MSENTEAVSQAFLNSIYTKEVILRRAWFFGQEWQSAGGESTIKENVPRMNLQPGNRVLDICCGPGGSVSHIARSSDVHVHGVDVSSDMISLARDLLAREKKEIRDKVTFEVADITDVDYGSNTYDVIYSQCSIVLIPDQEKLYEKLYKWLKPQGTLLITDICGRDQGDYSEKCSEFIERTGYHLKSLRDYSKLIEEAGFKDIEALDYTSTIMECIEIHSKQFAAKREDFLKNFSEEDYNAIVDTWKSKMKFFGAGELIWVIFQAKK